MAEAHHHRPTLKQSNKRFKSKHSTKSALKDAAKGGKHSHIIRSLTQSHPGRISRTSPKASATTNASAQTRLNRRNNAKQAQAKKRDALVSATRVFSGVDGAPRIVAVIPLCPDVDAKAIVTSLADALEVSADDCPQTGLWKIRAGRFKTSLQFINVPYRNFYAALDACKVADYVVFALSTSVEVDGWGDTLLRALQAQGLPEVVTLAASDSTIDTKSRIGILKSLLSFVQYFVPSQTRVFDMYVSSDRLNALRALSEGKPTDVRWREGRSWILGETTEWEDGQMKVTGVVRGSSLSANRLVHLPNFGDFQIAKILSAALPRHPKSGQTEAMDTEPAVLAEPDAEEADSLVSSNDPDDLANEQTWPTEEEMKGVGGLEQPSLPDAEVGTTPQRVKRIPKGMSAYQAAWIVDESDDEDDEDPDAKLQGEEVEMEEVTQEEEEMQDMPMDEDIESERRVAFEDLDNEEEERQLNSWRNRQREEEDDLQFPDEIDTPRDIPARVRFQRFRGMRSFRTSPWDPFENLPRDYARIFQFEDFKRTERGVRRRAEQEIAVVEPGNRVTVILKDVPQQAATTGPVMIFALLQHEHKTSVLNFTVQRNTEYDGTVRSKDPLLLCVGPRRLRVNPIYSQHTRGGGKGANNVHKFERFLRHGLTSVATTYGPVIFGTQPCIFLRETSDIQEDVHYFKPIQLHTKHGRTGHIRESLGTHGYLKAHFDGPINQMDTICMSLYKRVFPKFSTLWTISSEQEITATDVDAMEE
ncbi:hypothetical protein C0993_003756 [Termitomyces sp. T159_Od127]|nr:hypothetical protein C0993_003756 [Termitomyces sp. T159_Od127]